MIKNGGSEQMEQKHKFKIGQKVKVIKQNFGFRYIGKTGIITSLGSGVIPVHVTLDGEKIETDFAANELQIL